MLPFGKFSLMGLAIAEEAGEPDQRSNPALVGKAVAGLHMARLSVALTLVLLAGMTWAAPLGPPQWALLLVEFPGLLLWTAGLAMCTQAPAGRVWAYLSCAAGLVAMVSLVYATLLETALPFFLFGLSVMGGVATSTLFARDLSTFVGHPGLARFGCWLVAIPFGLFALSLIAFVVGLLLLLAVILGTVVYSDYLGRVARVAEEFQARA